MFNHLESAIKLVDGAGEDRSNKMREIMLNLAIAYALADDDKSANNALDAVLKRDPEDETAREIRNAMQ